MKNYITLAILVSLFSLGVQAQNDTLYIYENGVIVYQKPVTEIDSVVFSKPYVVVNDTTGTFTDSRDGSTYNWVKIGDQVWMAENLNYAASISWCYDNIAANCETYGRLYDGYTVSTICPSGWHLPNEAEWTEIFDYLGGKDVAGDKLKESGTTHWTSPNTGASNESGFTALASGYRNYDGSFSSIGEGSYWWSATNAVGGSTDVWGHLTLNGYSDVFSFEFDSDIGYSARCVRD